MAGVIGKVVLHRDRYARCIGLGDRKDPIVTTPCLVQFEHEDLSPSIAPFSSSTTNTLPREVQVRSLLPLEPPNFDVNGPTFEANIGHVLPPSLDNADAGEKASSTSLLPVSWQRLHHDPQLLDLEVQPEIIVLTDALQLAQQGIKLVQAILSIKKAFPGALLWTPAIGGPDNVAVLSWLGVDLFDLTRCREAEIEGAYITSHGLRQCLPGEEYQFEEQLRYWEESKKLIHSSFENGTLREYAEQQALNSPRLVEHLRYHRTLVSNEKGVLTRNVDAQQSFQCYSFQSFSDPLIQDWTSFIQRQYRSRDTHQDVLLLLPCSDRKPYRLSKSHSKFLDIIGNHRIEQLMVTSPLGLVPRNIEDVWPASHYDIPVTGSWSDDEVSRIQETLRLFLERHQFKQIINHSTIDVSELHENVVETRKGLGALSSESLRNLDESIKNAVETYDIRRMKSSHSNMQRFESIAEKNLNTSSWLNGCDIRGKPPRWRIEHEGKQIAVWSIDRNAFSFSKAAIDHLFEHEVLQSIELNEGVKLKGDIFPHMVKAYGGDLRKDDDVLVCQHGKPIGLARILAPGWEWKSGIGALAKLHQKK